MAISMNQEIPLIVQKPGSVLASKKISKVSTYSPNYKLDQI